MNIIKANGMLLNGDVLNVDAIAINTGQIDTELSAWRNYSTKMMLGSEASKLLMPRLSDATARIQSHTAAIKSGGGNFTPEKLANLRREAISLTALTALSRFVRYAPVFGDDAHVYHSASPKAPTDYEEHFDIIDDNFADGDGNRAFGLVTTEQRFLSDYCEGNIADKLRAITWFWLPNAAVYACVTKPAAVSDAYASSVLEITGPDEKALQSTSLQKSVRIMPFLSVSYMDLVEIWTRVYSNNEKLEN